MKNSGGGISYVRTYCYRISFSLQFFFLIFECTLLLRERLIIVQSSFYVNIVVDMIASFIN